MSSPHSTDPLDQIDSLLDDVLSSGWGDEPAPVVVPFSQVVQDDPAPPVTGVLTTTADYPPLPVKPAAKRAKTVPEKLAVAVLGLDGVPAFPEGPQDDEAAPHGLIDIGLLSDLATGRKGAVEAAEAAGVSMGEMQSQLAVALREVDPKEIAKALGIQAAEQQLKSGALYGVVLHQLVEDLVSGRMAPALKMDFAKMLADIGRIRPKEEKGVGVGGGFTLNISLGQQPVTIEAQT